MWGSRFKLEEVKRDLKAETLQVRQMAMQKLMQRVKEDHGIHPAALEIFRTMLDVEQDPWTIVQAATGIATIAGTAEGRNAWLRLLHHPVAQIVAHATYSTTDPTYYAALMDLLRQRSESSIHRGVLYGVGWMKVPESFAMLVEHLAFPEFLEDAIRALEVFGDIRAIPYLEPFLNDDSELAQRDERGAVLSVGDIASSAIRGIRASHQRGLSKGN